MEGYNNWILLVAEFTLKSLQSWQWASNSVYYLLGLWSRLVVSVPYLKGDTPSLLGEMFLRLRKMSSHQDSIMCRLDWLQSCRLN